MKKVKILMIDNYDSFTFNLFQYFGILGADVKVYRNNEIKVTDIEKKNIDKIVISPGPGNPDDAGVSMEIITKYCEKIPILGVCLGHQCIGQVFGGKIINAKNIMHGKTSKIIHNSKGIFKNIPKQFVATRYHSLVIERETIPEELEITAVSDDDEIMGIQHKKFSVYGIQFHPESILTTQGMNILKNFIYETD